MHTARHPGAQLGAALFPLVLFAAAGCNKQAEDTTAPAPPAPTGDAEVVAPGPNSAALAPSGRLVFEANRCRRCHVLSGQGGGKGPDLTHVGAEAEHTVEWLVAQIRNPKAHKPDSRMPSFEGKIRDPDRRALAEFLANQK